MPPATDDPPALPVTLANTEYFELESEAVGAKYAIWVTYPPTYLEDEGSEYPVIYVVDGNVYAAMLGSMCQVLAIDPVVSFAPYVQVSIGFTEKDAENQAAIRTRDLVPPGEPIAESFRELTLEQAASAGWSDEDLGDYFELLRDSHADRFLAFLEGELRPVVERRYRVQTESSGLFGYSYGGLFALYALCRSSMFDKVGAGSPAIFTSGSPVFALERELAEQGHSFDDVRLHLTLCELEMTGRSRAFRDLGIQYANLLDALYRSDHQGLDVTSQILPNETHSTGIMASFLSFMRACYVDA